MIILSTKRLREIRKHRKKKQWEIADLMGVKRPTYVGYEKNKDEIEVTAAVANSVAEFLNCQVTDIESQGNVENVEPLPATHLIEDGNYVSLHKLAWDEFQLTRKTEREALLQITKSNTNLSETIAEMAKNLIRPGGDQKR